MTQVQELLKMIETVDPSDTAKLDEIDARVWGFLSDIEGCYLPAIGNANRYTRSRDFLKAIRPEGYRWIIEITPEGDAVCHYEREKDEDSYFKGMSEKKTEELAELHAIIQAIAHDRDSRNVPK